MAKRFFSFGCSYTAYAWPTWSDFVGQSFPGKYYNYGRSGAANNFIFHHFVEMHERHKFTADDLIVIQWTETMRESRYRDNQWITAGSVINSYPNYYVEKYIDHRGLFIRDMSLLAATTHILDNIGCEYYYLGLNDFNPPSDIATLYAHYLNKILPSYQSVLGEMSPRLLCDQVLIDDLHPTPGEHYKFLSQVLPAHAPSDSMLADAWDKELVNGWNEWDKGWNLTWPGIDRGFLDLYAAL